MEIDYTIWNIVGIIVVFFVFIILFIRFSLSKVAEHVNTALISQIESNNAFFEKNNLLLFEKIEAKSSIIEKINTVLIDISSSLIHSKQKIEEINFLCDNRKNLENEIVKLKKIIKRLEKKNEI